MLLKFVLIPSLLRIFIFQSTLARNDSGKFRGQSFLLHLPYVCFSYLGLFFTLACLSVLVLYESYKRLLCSLLFARAMSVSWNDFA
jgi:hypothetical protein